MKKKKLRVALFFGGKSGEREVSLRSAQSIAEHLNSGKYEVVPVEVTKAGKFLLESETIRQIGKRVETKKIKSRELIPFEKNSTGKIDVALLALHGPGGEDGTIQGMLELLGIPYTDSGVLASALAMDKARTKRLVSSAGVPVLPHIAFSKAEYKKNKTALLSKLKGKVVVKPNDIGSSLGVGIAQGGREIERAIKSAFVYSGEIMIEPFLDGREITVPVLGNETAAALPAIEIIPWKKSKFYDYKAKYMRGGSEHVIPAKLTAAREREVKDLSVTVHQLVGCRGVTRVDFILDKKGRFYFLEINTIPGMTATSLVPQSAAAAGISYSKLLDILIRLAFEK